MGCYLSLSCIHDTRNLQTTCAKINYHRKLQSSRFQVCQRLLFVNRNNLRNSLQFQNHAPINKQVKFVKAHVYTLKKHIHTLLLFRYMLIFFQYNDHGFFINIFRKTRTKFIKHLIRRFHN